MAPTNPTTISILLIIITISTLPLTASATQPTLCLPDRIEATQKLWTIGIDLQLYLNGSQLGIVKQKIFSFTTYFNLQDVNSNVICYARLKFLTLGTQYQIYDNQDNKIGAIVQQYLQAMLTIGHMYTLYDGNGNIVGKINWTQIYNTYAEIWNNFNQIQAKMEKTSMFKDNWRIQFMRNTVDRRLLIFVPSIISNEQRVQRRRKQERQQRQRRRQRQRREMSQRHQRQQRKK